MTFVPILIAALAFAGLLGPEQKLRMSGERTLESAFVLWPRRWESSIQFANRSVLPWAIDDSFHTVHFMFMGLVLGLWH